MKQTLNQLFLVDNYRVVVGRLRLFINVRLLRKLKTMNSEDSFKVTVEHNMKGLKIFRNRRILQLISPLSVIETLHKDAKILIVGPRNENDLFLLRGHGFKKENIVGLDLISYSKHIKLGDMHDMPFESNSFDAVIVGWTLSYSRSPQKLADELVRVVKNNGVISMGVVYSTISNEDLKNTIGYSIAEEGYERINSTKEMHKLFGASVKEVFLDHDAPNKISNHSVKTGIKSGSSSVLTCFSVQK